MQLTLATTIVLLQKPKGLNRMKRMKRKRELMLLRAVNDAAVAVTVTVAVFGSALLQPPFC